jgi:hypothetical protein
VVIRGTSLSLTFRLWQVRVDCAIRGVIVTDRITGRECYLLLKASEEKTRGASNSTIFVVLALLLVDT